MVGVIPCFFWNFWVALQSAVDCLPSTGRFRNFSTCFWCGPTDLVQDAAWAAVPVPRTRAGAATSPATDSATPRRSGLPDIFAVTPMCANSPSPTVR